MRLFEPFCLVKLNLYRQRACIIVEVMEFFLTNRGKLWTRRACLLGLNKLMSVSLKLSPVGHTNIPCGLACSWRCRECSKVSSNHRIQSSEGGRTQGCARVRLYKATMEESSTSSKTS